MEWTKERIQALIETSDVALEHAILRLYERQTSDEQDNGTARYQNGMGFSGADAEFFSSLARQIQQSKYPEGKKLSPRQRVAARKAGIGKYHKQLLEVIQQQKEKTCQ